MSSQTLFEYAGQPELKEGILEIMNSDWKSHLKDEQLDLEFNISMYLEYRHHLNAMAIDISFVPRDFDFKAYIGEYVYDGISVLVTSSSGEKYLLNVTLQSMDNINDDLYHEK